MKKYTYKLTHTYSHNKLLQDVTFITTLAPLKITEIIAYIQFTTDDTVNGAELNSIETVTLLKLFYDNSIVIVENGTKYDYMIDEYRNWEMYSSESERIQSNEDYKRDGLEQFISSYISNYNAILNKGGVTV